MDRVETYKYAHDKYIIVGDVHGDFDTFITFIKSIPGYNLNKEGLITSNEEHPYRVFLVGDYVDKGSFKDIKKTIEFIYKNRVFITCCMGNHEYYCYLFATGKLKLCEETFKQINSWFKTVVLLLSDEGLKRKFLDIIIWQTYHHIETNEANITHAPCSKEYLGSVDAKGLKAQRNLILPRNISSDIETFLSERDECMKFIVEDANENDKYHIFGHVQIPDVFIFKNKIGLDTGSIIGNKLSTAWFENGEMTIKQYDSKMPKQQLPLPLFSEKFNIEQYEQLKS